MLFDFIMPLLGFHVAEWLKVWGDYIVAAIEIAGGVYLVFAFEVPVTPTGIAGAVLGRLLGPLHYVGFGLIGLGLITGAIGYGISIGGADCEAAWKAKNYEAEIAALKRDAGAKQIAATMAAAQAEQLARDNDAAQSQIADYVESAGKLGDALATCRRASADDVRRLCKLTGNGAPGCQRSR